MSVAVHLAEADSPEEARALHRQLWNQGVNPFLIVILPGQIRVYTGFAYDPSEPKVGQIESVSLTGQSWDIVVQALQAFTSDSIDRGVIWEAYAKDLSWDRRVDTTLLQNLRILSNRLCEEHSLLREASQALIGKFVYLAYLRARDILSDKWLESEVGLSSENIFSGEMFLQTIAHSHFRRLSDAVEARFNGKLFPIRWGAEGSPKAGAVQMVARIFSGEDAESGQGHLSFKAYDFASVPVEFLSSIYEQFLHSGSSDSKASDPEKNGAHYTPEPLADYLASEVNSILPLQLGMRVLDPCCGSGIFLVTAYRRLIEMECRKQGKISLNASELKTILVSSIYGVERNPVACQITGFSLILALLSYVDPPELHRRRNFKFPDLIGTNLFNQDFFDEAAAFWNTGLTFDWILGNPPWVEMDSEEKGPAYLLNWSNKHAAEYGFARNRTGEPFACRVTECLAQDGAIGLVLHAKSLNNEHLGKWRKAFFGNLYVRRLTNLSNFANVIFPSAKQPAVTLIYQKKQDREGALAPISHFGPFVANQQIIVPRSGNPKSWIIGFTESEIKLVSQTEAAKGDAKTWKMALWGNHRDTMALKRLRKVFRTTLGVVASENGWTIALGLQLRAGPGTQRDPNEEVLDDHGGNVLKGMRVLNHRSLVKTGGALKIPSELLRENDIGEFIRKGRKAGLALRSGPRLMLSHQFAAFTEDDFIILHSKIGVVGGTAEEMKAVAAVWNTDFAKYFLFLELTSEWGVKISQIHKRDAESLPFPMWNVALRAKLAVAWEEAALMQSKGTQDVDVRGYLNKRVAKILNLPNWLRLFVEEFFAVRYQMNLGKNPPQFRRAVSTDSLLSYAVTLRDELDGFVSSRVRHRVRVCSSAKGASVSVTVVNTKKVIEPTVEEAEADQSEQLTTLLAAAEAKVSQWFYVNRSVRLFDGDTIHLVKPSQQIEWTRTRALLDADDIISEAVEERRKQGP